MISLSFPAVVCVCGAPKQACSLRETLDKNRCYMFTFGLKSGDTCQTLSKNCFFYSVLIYQGDTEVLQSHQQSGIRMIVYFYHFRYTSCNIFGAPFFTFSSGDGELPHWWGKEELPIEDFAPHQEPRTSHSGPSALEILSPFFLLDYSCSYWLLVRPMGSVGQKILDHQSFLLIFGLDTILGQEEKFT